MAQELYPKIPCPYLWVLDQESLDLSRIPCLIRPDILPLFNLDRISIADTNSESPDHAREELVVCKNQSVNPDILLVDISTLNKNLAKERSYRKFDDDKLVLGLTIREHVRVLILN